MPTINIATNAVAFSRVHTFICKTTIVAVAKHRHHHHPDRNLQTSLINFINGYTITTHSQPPLSIIIIIVTTTRSLYDMLANNNGNNVVPAATN